MNSILESTSGNINSVSPVRKTGKLLGPSESLMGQSNAFDQQLLCLLQPPREPPRWVSIQFTYLCNGRQDPVSMNWEVSQKQGQNPEIFLSGISEWPVKERERYHTKENEICSCFQNQKKKKGMGHSCQAFGGKDHLDTYVLMLSDRGARGITQWVKYSLYRCEDWSPDTQHACKCRASMVAAYNPSIWVQRQELRLARLAKPMSSGLRKLCLCMERPSYRQPMVPSHTCMGIHM